MSLNIRTNASQGSPVGIGDLGFKVGAAGADVDVTEPSQLVSAASSDDLRRLATDEAFGTGSSTLILNDGSIDIPEADVDSFLRTVALPEVGPFSVPLRDENGNDTILGLSESSHRAVRQLIHLADGGGPFEGFATGAFRETLPSADPFPTSVIWWESSSKNQKIVEKTITYTGVFPTTIEWKAYDEDGTTILATVTDTITYSGPFETDRTRAIA